jgi:hypothetical protein
MFMLQTGTFLYGARYSSYDLLSYYAWQSDSWKEFEGVFGSKSLSKP